MKNFFRNLSTFSAGRTIVQAFSISLFAVIVVNAQTPASSTPSSAPSSTPAKGQPAAPASTGQTTTTGTQTTTQQSTEKGADPKKSADPKALLNQVEKADEKANDKNAATNEDADEAYRQAELTKMRRKIFGYQLFNNSKLSFYNFED